MTRRNILQTTTLAAASLPLASFPFRAYGLAPAAAEEPIVPPAPFTLVTGTTLAKIEQDLKAAPGNNNLYPKGLLPFSITVTTEDKKTAKEFEFHADHDHIFQVLEGTTVYDIGGTPKNPRNPKPNEWMAPDSDGFTTLLLKKGDTLVIPRGTPHRRKTQDSVTLMLITTFGALKE